MKTFEITAPDGKIYEVTGPDNATKEQALEQVKQRFADKVSQIPNNVAPSIPDKPMTAKGVGEAALSVATAIPAGIVGNVRGIGHRLTGGTMDQAQRTAADTSRGLTYEPRSDEGKSALESVGKVVDATKIAGIGPTEGMALAGSVQQARGAIGRGVAAVQQTPPEADLLKRGAAKVSAAVPAITNPEKRRLAYKAQALDIPLRPDMLTDNTFARMIGEAFEKVPLSGSRSDARQIGFNRALNNMIGGDKNAQRLTPDVFDRAMTQSGERIGEIAAKTDVSILDLNGPLRAQRKQASNFETSDVAKIVTNYVNEIESKVVDGVIPGDVFRKINSKIGRQMRTSTNGDLKHALGELQDDLHEALVRNIKNPEDLAALETARKQYAIGKAIEPLVAKAKTGDISPAGLMGAVTASKDKKSMMARNRAGDLGDLARIGQLFLKEPASSGTAERALTYGLIGGGAAINPAIAGGIYGAANLYNRLGPRLIANPLRKGQ